MSKEMSPNLLSYLEEERQFQEQHQKNKVRRVKIEKVNQAWLVRFLPVGLGERNLWFVRLGQHWMNRQPIFCPKCLSQDFGGDPNAECPVCEMAELLNAEDNEAVSNYGFRLKANLTYLTYCLVYQIDPGRGETQTLPESEVLKPWEFQHYKSSFDELMDYFRRGTTANRPFSVLDLEKGNDFWATRTTKGTRLDRQDPAPIFDLADPNYEQKIDQIWSAITQPRIKIPTLKELETFARKAEAAAGGDDEGDRRGGRGRGRGRDNDESDESDEPVDRPSRRVGRAPGRRVASASAEEPAPEPEQASAEEDQIPGAEVPARAPTRPASRAAAPVRSATAPQRQAPAQAGRPAPRAVASAPVVARPVGARSVPRPAAAASAQSSVDSETEDTGVAEEASDAAPAAEQPPPEESQDGQEARTQPEDQEEAPPAPVTRQTRAAPAANAGLRQRLINRVRAA
jgi:hypothetical protein